MLGTVPNPNPSDPRPRLRTCSIGVGASGNSVELTFTADQDLRATSLQVVLGGSPVLPSRIDASTTDPLRSFTATQPLSQVEKGVVKFSIKFANVNNVEGIPVTNTTDNSKVVIGKSVYMLDCRHLRRCVDLSTLTPGVLLMSRSMQLPAVSKPPQPMQLPLQDRVALAWL